MIRRSAEFGRFGCNPNLLTEHDEGSIIVFLLFPLIANVVPNCLLGHLAHGETEVTNLPKETPSGVFVKFRLSVVKPRARPPYTVVSRVECEHGHHRERP